MRDREKVKLAQTERKLEIEKEEKRNRPKG